MNETSIDIAKETIKVFNNEGFEFEYLILFGSYKAALNSPEFIGVPLYKSKVSNKF